MVSQPTVLHPLTLPALLDAILTSQCNSEGNANPTTLIVCSSREDFLHDLAHSVRGDDGPDTAARLRQLTAPTLRNLVAAKHVDVVFCASVPVLLAYLTACGVQGKPHGEGSGTRTFVLVNPLSLHAPTPSFSAQGLSRTFATAVEMAMRVRARLVVVEAQGSRKRNGNDSEEEEADAAMRDDHEAHHDESEHPLDPWEQEVPILNDAVRRSAPGGGERTWAGRTVKVHRIAARWFRFCRVKEGKAGGLDL